MMYAFLSHVFYLLYVNVFFSQSVDTKYKKVKNETKAVKKKGHNTEIPGVSTASRSDTIKQPATSKAPSQSKVGWSHQSGLNPYHNTLT